MPHKNFTVSYKKKSAIDKNLTQKKTIFVALTLREKCPNTESLYIPVFGLNIGKYEPEKTPYLDTFHAVAFTCHGP